MQEGFRPLSRNFSLIPGLQSAYTLIYALDADPCGGACRLSLMRTGEIPTADSVSLALEAGRGYELLRYLCENAVQPENWRDVIQDIAPKQETGKVETV